MFFRRKKDGGGDPGGRRRILRSAPRQFSDFEVFLESHLEDVYRGQIEDTLVLQLDSSIEEPIKVRLDDLCIQGCSVLVPTPVLPPVKEGEIVGVRIEHKRQAWRVLTPGLIRGITHETRRYTRFGLEFVNAGNLYSQMEDGLGAYFNRRGAVRIRNDGMIDCQIRAKAMRLRARVIDVSVSGMGAWVSHVEAAGLHTGDPVRLVLTPRDKSEPMEGGAQVVRKESHGPHDVLGLCYIEDQWDEENMERLEIFVHTYLSKRLRWSA